MRPTLLNPLFAPVTTLPGVGPKQDKLLRYLLSRSETPRLVDLLLHLPASVIDRRARPKIRDAVQGTVVTLEVTVDRHRPPPPRNARAPFLVYASDDTGDVVLTFFRAKPGYVEKLLPVGEKRYVSGTLQMYDGIPQIVHPDRVIDEAGFSKLTGIDPVYPLTEGLALGSLRRAVAQALTKASRPAGMDQPGRAPPLPVSAGSRGADPGPCPGRTHGHPARRPVLVAAGLRRTAGGPTGAGAGARAVAAPGRRSTCRRRASAEQDHRRAALRADDLAARRGRRHHRGSAPTGADAAAAAGRCRLGKTVVALLAAAAVTEAGKQAALMAPTEILARQHIKTITPLAERAGMRVAILTGREKGKERREILARLEAGEIDFLVGTHALIQDDVIFKIAGAGGGRRTASFRRARAAGAHQQGRSRRCAGAERDADPAHAGADVFRRHGRLGIAREAGRPPADRYPHPAQQPARRSRSTASAAR